MLINVKNTVNIMDIFMDNIILEKSRYDFIVSKNIIFVAYIKPLKVYPTPWGLPFFDVTNAFKAD